MRRVHRGDAGFTLLEVVVAMVIFTVFAATSLGLLIRTTSTTSGNLRRTAAANLAAEQIEIARSASAVDIPVPKSPDRTQTVGNVVYTISQSAKYLSPDSTSSVCDGSSASLAYKLVTVQVTWPDMGSIKPVRADTLKAVGVGTDGLGATGSIALTVAASTGTALPGVTVTLSDGTQAVTDDAGCAVFTGLVSGTYTASLSLLGYVGLANTQLVTKSGLGVTAGTLSRSTVSYDAARTAVLRASSAATGGIIPSGLQVLFSSSILTTPTAYPVCPASGTPASACATAPATTLDGQAQQLYPGIYTVKLGTCTETLPSQTSLDLSGANSSGTVATLPMGAITVNITKAALAYAGTKTVTITHVTGCSESYTIPLTSTGARILVPYGSWNVSVPSTSSTSTPVTTTTVPIVLSGVTQTGTASLAVTS